MSDSRNIDAARTTELREPQRIPSPFAKRDGVESPNDQTDHHRAKTMELVKSKRLPDVHITGADQSSEPAAAKGHAKDSSDNPPAEKQVPPAAGEANLPRPLEVKTLGDGTRVTKMSDGSVVTDKTDFSRETKTSDGKTVVEPPKRTKKADGTVVTEAPDQYTFTHKDGKELSRSFTSSNGDKATLYADDSSVHESADGTKLTLKMDKNEKTFQMSFGDGTTVSRTADGTTVTKKPDGTEITDKPDFTRVTKNPAGDETTESPTVIIKKDQSKVLLCPDGSVVTKDKDDKVIAKEYGSRYSLEPAGPNFLPVVLGNGRIYLEVDPDPKSPAVINDRVDKAWAHRDLLKDRVKIP